MTFIIFILFVIVPGYYTEEDELWRAEDVVSQEVLEEFQDRAHYTDEIWKVNNTIDFTIHEKEKIPWKDFLEIHNITVKVLDKNVTGKIDAEFYKKYDKNITKRSVAAEPLSLENSTALVLSEKKVIEDKEKMENITSSTGGSLLKQKNFTLMTMDNLEKTSYTLFDNVTETVDFMLPLKNITDIFESESSNDTETRRANVPPMDINKQPTFNEIAQYLHKMAAAFPDRFSLKSMAKTLHSNDIFLVKITAKRQAPIVMIESGIHGNGWGGIHAVLQFMHELTTDFSKYPHVYNKDWYIIPVLNPDGYDHSVKKKDMKWRKNTHRFTNCIGVDINRNFGFNWGARVGDPTNPCNYDFSGDEAFSEIESRAIRDFVTEVILYGYISIHSVGAKVLSPSVAHKDLKTHNVFTREMAGAMKKATGNEFHHGPLLKSSGVSVDWVYHTGKVTHSYVITPKGEGVNANIPNSIKEIRAALLKLAEMLKVYSWNE